MIYCINVDWSDIKNVKCAALFYILIFSIVARKLMDNVSVHMFEFKECRFNELY